MKQPEWISEIATQLVMRKPPQDSKGYSWPQNNPMILK